MRRCALALTVSLCLLPSNTSRLAADEFRGHVVAVSDGDTITILKASNDQVRVRLNGIDAPESGQAFGQVAKRGLSDLVFGQDVTIIWSKIDRYGRIVGTVLRGTTNANLEQLKAGLAWYYHEYARDVAPELRDVYAGAEAAAKAARRGLWSDPAPSPPWQFRHPSADTAAEFDGQIIGNKNSRVYHLPRCPDYLKVSATNRVFFADEQTARASGYRIAGNCR